MTVSQVLWNTAAALLLVATLVVFGRPLLGRRLELALDRARDRGLRFARRRRRQVTRRAAAYALMAAQEITRRRAGDADGHHDPGPAYPVQELEAIAELELRLEARGD